MAIALDAVGTLPNLSNPGTLSFTTSGSNRILFGLMMGDSPATGTLTGFKYAGVSLTKIIGTMMDNGFDQRRAELWYLVNPASGANNLIGTLSSGDKYALAAISYTGVAQSSPIEGSVSGTFGGATSYAGTITTSTNNAWLINCVAHQDNLQTAQASTNRRFTITIFSSDQGVGGDRGPNSPAGAFSTGYTSSSVDGAIVVASFVPVASGVATTNQTFKTLTGAGNI